MKLKLYSISALLTVGLLITSSANAQWTRNAATLQTYLTNTGDNVGIGTTNPTFKLDVQSTGIATMSFKSSSDNASILLDRGASTKTASLTYRTAGSNNWQTGCVSNNNFTIRNNSLASVAMFVDYTNNNVGIGTITPGSKLSVNGSASVNGNAVIAGNLSIGTTASNGSLQFGNALVNRRIVLYETANNDHQYYGFGINADALRYQVSGPNASHIFYAGSSATTSNQLMRIQGDGSISIGAATTTSRLTINGPQITATLTDPGLLQLGEDNDLNLNFDLNQIQARNNGDAGNLFLNAYGGNTAIGGFLSPETELQVNHNSSSGSIFGFRIRNMASNNHYWTLYTTNATDNLEMNYLGTAKGNFNGVSGAYTAVSDRKFKKDLENVSDVLSKVKQLELLKYHFNEQKSEDRKFIGMIAQDVEKVFPEVVYNNKTDDGGSYYTMDYSAFGLIAIKAVQELSNENETLKKQLSDMNDCIQTLCNNQSSKIGAAVIDNSQLFQNQPNPFNQQTVINYQLKSNDANAKIIIRDLNGNLVKQVSLSQTGKGQVTINANELAQGTYTYTLEVNGTSVDTKLMVLVK